LKTYKIELLHASTSRSSSIPKTAKKTGSTELSSLITISACTFF